MLDDDSDASSDDDDDFSRDDLEIEEVGKASSSKDQNQETINRNMM